MQYYISFSKFQHELKNFHNKHGFSATYPQMLSILFGTGSLDTTLPKLPQEDLWDSLSDEDFYTMLCDYPISVSTPDSMTTPATVTENLVIPDTKDIFVLQHFHYINNTLHTHDFFEVNYVFKGRCQFAFENDSRMLNEGELCIIAPSSLHDIHIEDENAIVITILIRKSTFDKTFFTLLTQDNLLSYFFNKLLYEKAHANYLLFFIQDNRSIKKIIKNLTLECSKEDSYSNNCCISWMNLLFSLILRNYTQTIQFYNYAHGSDFSLILQYVQHNYTTTSLAELAKFFHYSEPYLSTLFQKNTGHSYSELVKNLRMRDALKYLENSEMKITEIAEKTGYNSTDHFSRTFRSLHKMSPQLYRKKYREQNYSL